MMVYRNYTSAQLYNSQTKERQKNVGKNSMDIKVYVVVVVQLASRSDLDPAAIKYVDMLPLKGLPRKNIGRNIFYMLRIYSV